MRPSVTATSNSTAASTSLSANKNRLLFVTVSILALIGMTVSAVALQRHYAKSSSTFCEFGEKFSCDIVNRSEYSTVMGIPVAAIGVAGYAAIFALATLYRSRAETPLRLIAAAVAGLAFALYLTYIEGFVLDAWCILCLTSLATIAGITICSALIKLRVRSRV
jgi:vitamin-K-epoxide reductase (warfarin-sensitive)